MARTASATQRARSAILKAALALSLALSPVQAWADTTPEGKDPDHRFAYELRDDHLAGAVDRDAAPVDAPVPALSFIANLFGQDISAFQDSGHTLYVKSTLFDAPAAGSDRTLDAIYAREDWISIIAGQYASSADLLDPGPDSGFYVALAAPSSLNGTGTATDHVFALMTNEGEVLDGCRFDAESGIAYVPKSFYQQEGQDIPFACQLQLLIPATLEDSEPCLTDVSISSADPRVKTMGDATISSSAFDVTTTIPVATPETAAHLALSDIHVRLNGSDEEMELIEGKNAAWHATTGMLEISASPQTVLRADVSCDAPSLLELFTEPAQAASTSSLDYVPEVVFDSLNLDTLTPGRKMEFMTNADYWWPNPPDLSWHACVNTGAYCYSWKSDPNSLYEYLAWSSGADWSGVSKHEVGSFVVDPGGTQESRDYFNYSFDFGDYQIEDQSFHSEKWPITNPYNYGRDYTQLGLQCSHVKNPIGTMPSDGSKGRMALRVLDVNTEAARPYVVIGFVGPSIANQPGVGIYKFEILPSGGIEVAKSSSIPDTSANNPNYRFEGITYDVFSDEACTSHVCSITLGPDGRGSSKRLKDGTYYVRENAGSTLGSGFTYDSAAHAVTVRAGETTALAVSDAPQSYTAEALLRKCDSVTANSTPQGDGLLKGAVFEARHYRELFTDEGAAAACTPARTWRFATDAGGCIKLDEDHLVSGDALYRTTAGAPCLPLGTLTLREVSAPEGYRIDSSLRVIALPATGTAECIPFTMVSAVPEDIMRGGVTIMKRDAESGLTDPLGAASLDGTAFQIRNASAQAVCVDGVMRAPGEIVTRIVSEGGCARTAPDALPFGTYEIQETAAGTGYLASDTDARTFSITHDGEMVTLDGISACRDQVKRGDLDFRKVLQTDQSRLARIPFILESLTTGERHVLVTDENGIVNTSAAWHAHTQDSNANDWAIHTADAPEGAVDSAQLDPEAGNWFGLAPDGSMTAPDDALGALPYDTYALTELRADSNAGLDLISVEGIRITAHGLSIPLGDIEDRVTPPPAIVTLARSAHDASKHLHPNRDVRVTDRIDYCNLEPGTEYRVYGRLMDAETASEALDAAGEPITTELTFTPAASSGSCEVSFAFDASSLSGKRLVCFEEVIETTTEKTVASHEELDDHGQSVEVMEPAINTYATDAGTDSKEAIAQDGVTIMDAVAYSGLEEGAEYVLRGQLMRKTGTEDAPSAEAVLGEDGEPLVCTVPFTPISSTGSTSVAFTFTAAAMPDGAELVVYETLSRDGRELVVHDSPDNDAQTVRIVAPHISTNAFDDQSGLNAADAKAGLTITDEVRYENLMAGKTYSLFGTVMRATEGEGGHITAEPLLDHAGNKVSATVQFAPGSPSGSVFLDFQVDASELDGARLVIFERLTAKGQVVAVHEDAAAESQTIWIGSTAQARGSRSPTTLPQTGDDAPWIPAAAICIAATLGLACATWMRTRRKHQRAQTAARTGGAR